MARFHDLFPHPDPFFEIVRSYLQRKQPSSGATEIKEMAVHVELGRIERPALSRLRVVHGFSVPGSTHLQNVISRAAMRDGYWQSPAESDAKK